MSSVLTRKQINSLTHRCLPKECELSYRLMFVHLFIQPSLCLASHLYMHSTEHLRISSISVTGKRKDAWLLPSGSSEATGVDRYEPSKCLYVRLQLVGKLWEKVRTVVLTPVGDQKTLSWGSNNRAVIWRRNKVNWKMAGCAFGWMCSSENDVVSSSSWKKTNIMGMQGGTEAPSNEANRGRLRGNWTLG